MSGELKRYDLIGGKVVMNGGPVVDMPEGGLVSAKEARTALSTAEQKIVGLKAELRMELDYAGDCREKLDDEKEKVRDLRKELSTAEQRIEELGKVLAANQKAWADLFEQNIEQAATIAELRAERENRPKVVCFCGSSRFIAQMAVLMWEWEKAGHITMGLHYLPSWYGENRGWGPNFDHAAELEGLADKMDELHKRKIDLADEIFVVNVGGYIGESTRSEIQYAEAHGKPIKYLEPLASQSEKEKPHA